MQKFEMRFLDRLQVAILRRDYAARDDLDALGEAQRLSSTHAIEVWQGTRRVALVKKNNGALNEHDRRSL